MKLKAQLKPGARINLSSQDLFVQSLNTVYACLRGRCISPTERQEEIQRDKQTGRQGSCKGLAMWTRI